MTGSQIVALVFAAAALIGIGMVIGVYINIKSNDEEE